MVQFCKIVHKTHLSDYLPTSTVGSSFYGMASLSALGIHPILCKLYCHVLEYTQLGKPVSRSWWKEWENHDWLEVYLASPSGLCSFGL